MPTNWAVIYGLLDPRTNVLRYVGKAVDIAQRAENHLYQSATGRTHKDRWLRRLLGLGLEPLFAVLGVVPHGRWEREERKLIAEYRAAGFPLVNSTAGGEGVDAPRTVTWRRRISEAQQGRKPTPQALENQSTGSRFSRRTHCSYGHQYLPGSFTIATSPNGRETRVCNPCRRRQSRAQWQARKEQVNSRRRKGTPKGPGRKSLCIRGHAQTPGAFYLIKRGQRTEHRCKACHRLERANRRRNAAMQ